MLYEIVLATNVNVVLSEIGNDDVVFAFWFHNVACCQIGFSYHGFNSKLGNSTKQEVACSLPSFPLYIAAIVHHFCVYANDATHVHLLNVHIKVIASFVVWAK